MDLKPTAEQEPLWQAYVDKVRALGNDLARERGRRPAQANVEQQPAADPRLANLMAMPLAATGPAPRRGS